MTSGRTILIAALWLLAPAAGAQTLLFAEPGEAPGDEAGLRVALVGDVDADGAQDFAIGSPLNDVGGDKAGMARVYSGRTRLPLHTWYGSAADERLGMGLAGAGDLDSDGHDDVLVGAPGGAYVDVFSGQSGLVLYRLTWTGGDFGYCVAGGGQIDGDGVPDLLVGAPSDSSGGASWGGTVFVFSGAAGASIRTHSATACGAGLGWSVTFYGDVDGDGRSEYAAGMPGSVGCSPTPKVFAYEGASGTQLWENSASLWSDQLGWSVAGLSDVTGDGVGEVIVGAPQDPGIGCGGCNGKGYVRLLDGATGSPLWQANGTSYYSGLGGAVVAVGDLDGDGYEDVAASQPETTGGGGATRPVQLLDGETGALLLQIPVPSGQRWFGWSMDSGDVNADGLRDLLAGTPGSDLNGPYSGATYAYTVVLDVVTYCQAKVNSQGCTPSIFATGTASLTAGNLRVKALDVVNNKNGLLFWGRMPVAMPLQGGYLCVVPPILRTTLQWSGGNPPPDDCSGSYSYQFTPAYMASKGMQAGDQIYCQYWSRDPQGFVGTSLTGGLAFYVLP